MAPVIYPWDERYGEKREGKKKKETQSEWRRCTIAHVPHEGTLPGRQGRGAVRPGWIRAFVC